MTASASARTARRTSRSSISGAARHAQPAGVPPADAIETAECWELALRRTDEHTPAVLALTRQNLPTTVRGDAGENLLRQGRLSSWPRPPPPAPGPP
jgi:hypothetical protein